ncbi:MAG: hypothetical protein WCI73_09195, partial [Phycisphaerae bacterium]
MITKLPLCFLLGFATLLGGCSTAIVPLKPITTVEVWVAQPATAPTSQAAESEPATRVASTSNADTQAATAPSTQLTAATATAPASNLIKRTRVVDPNQTVRYVYRGNYQHIWQEATSLLTHLGYTIDRHDYRLGVL